MVKAHFSKRIGKFTGDRRVLVFLILASLLIAGRVWLAEHPEHDPWAPLDLRDPVGWATEAKLQSLREDVAECRGVLDRSDDLGRWRASGLDGVRKPRPALEEDHRFSVKSCRTDQGARV